MLAQEEYVEVHALRKRGWSISAIARQVALPLVLMAHECNVQAQLVVKVPDGVVACAYRL